MLLPRWSKPPWRNMLVNGVTQLPRAPPALRVAPQLPLTITSGITPNRMTSASAPRSPRLRLPTKTKTLAAIRLHVTTGVRRV